MVAIHGDWHGNTKYACKAICRDALDGADIVLQLGDFGLWPGPDGESYLRCIESAAKSANLQVWWIAGNHENWGEIDRLVAEHGWENPIEMSPHLSYLPNGCRFEFGGKKFGVLGGAFSVDYAYRKPYVSWWPQEMPTYADVEHLGEEPLDVLLTHDGPEKLQSSWKLLPDDEAKCDGVQGLIRQAIWNTHARSLYHGHWHQRASYEWDYAQEADGEVTMRTCRVSALAEDGRPLHLNRVLIATAYI